MCVSCAPGMAPTDTALTINIFAARAKVSQLIGEKLSRSHVAS